MSSRVGSELQSNSAQRLVVGLLVLAFASALYLSLDFGAHTSTLYIAEISPVGDDAALKVVFYGDTYRRLSDKEVVATPAGAWVVEQNADSTVLSSNRRDAVLKVRYSGEAFSLGFLRYPSGGEVRLLDASGRVRMLHLRGDPESVEQLRIGGQDSDLTPIPNDDDYALSHVYGFVIVLLSVASLAANQLRLLKSPSKAAINPPRIELAGYLLPVFGFPLLLLLALWPGSFAYDNGLQWAQAVGRVELDSALVITATLFFRLFSLWSSSPAPVVVCQVALGALGIALVLRELRWRGVPYWACQATAFLLGALPQYPSLMTQFGKDAWSCIGLLYLFHALLVLTRSIRTGQLPTGALVALLIAAVFSGAIRPNTLPSVLAVVILFSAFLYRKGHRQSAVCLGLAFLILSVGIPKMALYYYEKDWRSRESSVTAASPLSIYHDVSPPLGLFAYFYIYHVFAAAVSSDVALDPEDSALFFRIAPKEAWKNYDCRMVDSALAAVSKGMALSEKDYVPFIVANQLAMATAVARIVYRNPGVLVGRQLCISRMLWYIGYQTKPFQTTATTGYDNVPEAFLQIAGPNHSKLPKKYAEYLNRYIHWSEGSDSFWIFWKPALPLLVGSYAGLLYCAVRRETDLLLPLALPILLTLALAVVIPFPAFRYQFPASLLFTLLIPLFFASNVVLSRKE